MWKCEKCSRSFRNENQNHYCGKIETIDQYINEQDEKLHPILENVRKVIKNCYPLLEEKISWQMPTFWFGENVVHFAAHKNHLGFYPGDLSQSPFLDKLEGIKHSKGAIQFKFEKIDFELIETITKWRVEIILKGKDKK